MLKIGDQIMDAIRERHPEVFKVEALFHYTSFETFAEFVKDDADFYCTHYAVLNDSSEVKIGLKRAVEMLVRRIHLNEEQSFQLLSTYESLFEDRQTTVPWIMSFSKDGDSLHQWIGYTNRAKGGYAIGFDAQKLFSKVRELTFRSRDYSLMLVPCLYIGKDDDLIDVISDMLFKEITQQLQQADKSGMLEGDSLALLAQNVRRVLSLAALIKDKSFVYEKEYRLILIPEANRESRCEFIGGKPRWPLGLNWKNASVRNLISSVVVSPHGNRQMLTITAKMLTARHKMKACEIKHSSSPYNGM